MVLDVARALDVLGIGGIALELGEDRGERLAHEVGQHVEPAAMRHADDELLHAELAAALDDLLQRRDQRLRRPRGRSAWCRCSACRGSARTLSAAVSRSRMARLPSRGEIGVVARRLDALLDPAPSASGSWMCMYSTPIVAAIGRAQRREDLAQRRRLEAEHVVDEDRPVVVGLGEAVGPRDRARDAARASAGRADRASPRDGRARDRRGSASSARIESSVAWRMSAIPAAAAAARRGPCRCRRRSPAARPLPMTRSARRPGRRPRSSASTAGALVVQVGEEVAPALVDRGRVSR